MYIHQPSHNFLHLNRNISCFYIKFGYQSVFISLLLMGINLNLIQTIIKTYIPNLSFWNLSTIPVYIIKSCIVHTVNIASYFQIIYLSNSTYKVNLIGGFTCLPDLVLTMFSASWDAALIADCLSAANFLASFKAAWPSGDIDGEVGTGCRYWLSFSSECSAIGPQR